jgi:hypothetical protein
MQEIRPADSWAPGKQAISEPTAPSAQSNQSVAWTPESWYKHESSELESTA